MLLTFSCISSSCLGTDTPASAKADLAIVKGGTCNEPGPLGTVRYLKNANPKKSIIAKVRILEAPSEGKSTTRQENYVIAPSREIELGCDKVGGGAPIVVDISWSVESAKYK